MIIPTSKISSYTERKGKIEVEDPCVSSSFLSDPKHQVPCLRKAVILASNLLAISKITYSLFILDMLKSLCSYKYAGFSCKTWALFEQRREYF